MMSKPYVALCAIVMAMTSAHVPSTLAADSQVAVITIKAKQVEAKDCATQADEKKLEGDARTKFMQECEKAAKEKRG